MKSDFIIIFLDKKECIGLSNIIIFLVLIHVQKKCNYF